MRRIEELEKKCVVRLEEVTQRVLEDIRHLAAQADDARARAGREQVGDVFVGAIDARTQVVRYYRYEKRRDPLRAQSVVSLRLLEVAMRARRQDRDLRS